VYYVAFSACERSVPVCYSPDVLRKECTEATQELGIPSSNVFILDFDVRNFLESRQQILERMIVMGKDIQPDLIIVPSSFDTHQDHQVVHEESIRAFKRTSSIWGMEHAMNNLSFRTDIFVSLDEKHMNKKIDSIKKYESQTTRRYFTAQYITSIAYTRGMMIDKPYAEAFECIRSIF
jgi:N-acetylglucosamine malate deacetylase 1